MQTRNLAVGVPDPVRHGNDYLDHVSHAKPGIKVFPDVLYVICVISNPCRYRTRYELYRAFEKHMEESGAILYTVEMAYGGRPFEITEANNPYHIQLRSDKELWFKENMINIGISRLPSDWKYVAWIDADTMFVRPDWVQETIHQLQHHKFVQMFSQVQNVDSNYRPISAHHSVGFVYNWHHNIWINIGKDKKTDYPYACFCEDEVLNIWKWYGPPGGAWAAQRDAIDEVGGVIDVGILGSGDVYMASALIGELKFNLQKGLTKEYVRHLSIWEERATLHIRRNIGYVDGLMIHYWHGSFKNRGYETRNEILIRHKFNPDIDLKRDWQGLWQLVDHGEERSVALRDKIRGYFRRRQEDLQSS